jgi:hypothetical protein
LAVVVVACLVQQPIQLRIRMKHIRVLGYEVTSLSPETGKGASVVEDIHVEAVLDLVISGKAEDIVVYVAEEMNIWLDAPVELVVLQSWVLVEETAVPAAHLVVGKHVAFADADMVEVGERVHVAVFVDPFWCRPVFDGDQLVEAGGRGNV